MAYEEYFEPWEVATFKRVKRGQMNLARVRRGVVCQMVAGVIDGNGTNKEFVLTSRGRFRLANGDNSDNTTETAAHVRMGVQTVCMDDPESMADLFRLHGLPGASSVASFHDLVKQALRDDDDQEPLF
jgi:hypothetical protein